MAHLRDVRMASLLKKVAVDYFVMHSYDPVVIVDAQMIDKRTLHLYYMPRDMSKHTLASLEELHQKVLKQIPSLRHHMAKNTALKAIPTIYLKLSLHD